MIPIEQVRTLIRRQMNPGVQHHSLGSLQSSEGLLPVQCSFLCSQVSTHAENLVIEVLRVFVFFLNFIFIVYSFEMKYLRYTYQKNITSTLTYVDTVDMCSVSLHVTVRHMIIQFSGREHPPHSRRLLWSTGRSQQQLRGSVKTVARVQVIEIESQLCFEDVCREVPCSPGGDKKTWVRI